MPTTHTYEVQVKWTGNLGEGTSNYRSYSRDHEITANTKPAISASSDPAFRGDRARWNPEEMLVAALSQCHLLWYLALASAAGVVVTDYTDIPIGTMVEERDGGGEFSDVVLRPVVTIADESMRETATRLHADASAKCFIARSVNFPVRHEPVIEVVAQ